METLLPLLAAGRCRRPLSLVGFLPVSYLCSQRFQQACYQGPKGARVGLLIADQGLQPAQRIHAQVPLLVPCQTLLDCLDLLLHLPVSAGVKEGPGSGPWPGVAQSMILPPPSPSASLIFMRHQPRGLSTTAAKVSTTVLTQARDITAPPAAQRAVGFGLTAPGC